MNCTVLESTLTAFSLWATVVILIPNLHLSCLGWLWCSIYSQTVVCWVDRAQSVPGNAPTIIEAEVLARSVYASDEF